MSTVADEVRPRKHFTAAEIEAELAVAPHLIAPLTCQELCGEIQNDMDTLQNLEDFPANQRARVRIGLLRAIVALRHQLKQQHCPDCQD